MLAPLRRVAVGARLAERVLVGSRRAPPVFLCRVGVSGAGKVVDVWAVVESVVVGKE